MGNVCEICQDHDHGHQHDEAKVTIDPSKINVGLVKAAPPQTQLDIYRLSHQAEITLKNFQGEKFQDVPISDLLVKDNNKFVYIPEVDVFYKGQWKVDKPFGRGEIILKNGAYVQGLFTNYLCYGKDCLLIFPNGSYYRGGFVNNKCEGVGKFIDRHIVYEGHWKDNFPNGEGKEIYPNGDVFQGLFQNGMKSGDFSTYQWNNGEYKSYVGTFFQGKMEGRGTLKKINGTTLDGVFQEDKIYDVTIRSEKATFQGQVPNKQLSGHGKLIFNDSKQTYEGKFVNGELHGKCQMIDQKGRRSQTEFYKGRRLRTFKGLTQKEIDKLIDVTESSYKVSDRHSQALTIIQKRVGNEYYVKFVQPFQARSSKKSHLIIDICEKVILFEKI